MGQSKDDAALRNFIIQAFVYEECMNPHGTFAKSWEAGGDPASVPAKERDYRNYRNNVGLASYSRWAQITPGASHSERMPGCFFGVGVVLYVAQTC